MKTPKEWSRRCVEQFGYSVNPELIRQVQEETLREAAEVCRKQTNNACDVGFASQYDCAIALDGMVDKLKNV